ncbi:hypothetical protein LJC27_01140 [Christensenellaceae bacterium OttesenSCG-928-M15]|nr:hypothetical protein [Christensenellaceae bacterium OttesenSCG-928-M15]
MKNLWFSKSLYVEGIRRLKLVGLVFMLICVIITGLQLALSGSNLSIYGYLDITGILDGYLFFGPLVMVFTLFSFQFRRSSSDLYHALPITRTGLYITFSLSALTVVIGTILITRLVALVYLLCIGNFFNGMFFFLQTLAYCLGAMLVTGCTLIAVSATGTRFSAFVVAGVILFLPRCITTLCAAVLTSEAPMLIISEMGMFFDYSLNIPVASFLHFFMGGNLYTGADAMHMVFPAASQIYTLVLALLYMALGCVAFNRRASETAEKSAPSRKLQHLYRCLLISPLLLLLSIYMVIGVMGMDAAIMVLVVVTLLVYFLYELITTRRFKNLISSLYVLPIPVILSFVIVLGTLFFANAQMAKLPAVQDVKSVQLTGDGSYSGSYSSILVREIEFTDPELIAIAVDGLQTSYDMVEREQAWHLDNGMRFHYTSGGSTTRKFSVSKNKAARYAEMIASNEAYQAAQKALPEDSEIYRIYAASDRRGAYHDDKRGDAVSLKSIMALLRQDTSFDSAFVSAAQGVDLPAWEDPYEGNSLWTEGDFNIGLVLGVEGLRNGYLIDERYALGSRTPNAANAAMHYANEKEKDNKERVKSFLDGRKISNIYMEWQLYNVPQNGKKMHSGTMSMHGYENEVYLNRYNSGEYKADMTMAEFSTLVLRALNTELSAVSVDGPLLRISFEIGVEDGNAYDYVNMNAVYVPLEEGLMRDLLRLTEVSAFHEDAVGS